MDNVIEVMNVKGWKCCEIMLISMVEYDCIMIVIVDSGFGILEDWWYKVFEFFFMVKGGSGWYIGIGLLCVQQVVVDYGGIIDFDESLSGGCVVIVEFCFDGDLI